MEPLKELKANTPLPSDNKDSKNFILRYLSTGKMKLIFLLLGLIILAFIAVPIFKMIFSAPGKTC